ncbi:cytosine permease [uncultured Paludibaculum sp.]|uniref:cytosine permease n=1 Tax=uncultured Paludibaculum sp. TaxID=1765020 RepID=UPI002AAB7BC3|nr:cytosine permease [uncultured Paludibaculum sp.]
MLPDYLSKAVPNPASNRAPWYKNTAPSYAGIFLWIAFYNSIAAGTITRGTLTVCLLALAAAGLLSYGLFYYVPATLGMKTGYPLYVIGSSTFGTRGGYFMPGLLMGVLQVGWLGVGTFFATKFILAALAIEAGPGSLPFIITGVLWGYTMASIGVLGLQYVARVATFLNFIPLVMILVVFVKVSPGVSAHVPSEPNTFIAFTLLLQIVIGFFATAGAAGTDFGSNSRNAGDVKWGGLVGIVAAVLVAGGLPLVSVAGARVLMPNVTSYNYDAVVAGIGGPLATAMFFLFTLASIPPACFSSFIAGNSFSTMLPGVPRVGSTMAGMTVAIILAVTGVAENLVSFFTIVGASFGPICGAMAADYFLSGRKWAGPREGINWAGYGAWAVGFLVGLIPFLPVSKDVQELAQPAVVYSFLTGFVVYWGLAKAGLEPKTLAMPR